MKKFEFSKSGLVEDLSSHTVFSGQVFYNAHNKAEFLRHREHIETILSKGHELRKMLKEIAPGERVTVVGVYLNKKTPLLVRKTGPKVAVGNYEFTANRLCGLAAAYAFDNRYLYPALTSSEAHILGLTWNESNTNKCRLFLSAVSGSEHFYDQFLFWPLVCALRKFYKKKITLEPVIKMAKIKNKDGVRMGQDMMQNIETIYILWRHFPGTSDKELKSVLRSLPAELKDILK